VDKPVLPLEKDQVGKKIAIVIGGLLGGLFVLVFLIIKKIVQNSLKCAVIIPSQNKTTC
jgi:LPS O-antigen subunit length determinant protein (WzzB/FepE family)